MTQSFINPLSKFTTDTLKTLPYAKLYFFENESSTPKEVFKNKAKSISWGVFATADSAGNFAPIWYDGVCRAELRNAAGVVQTQWPIDDIGTDESFDTDITVAGDLTAENLISTGVVEAAGNAGFQSTSYTLNTRNPIWSFGNADTYGISYFAGTPSIGTSDAIGIHFGTATEIGSKFTFDSDGNLAASGTVSAAIVSAPAVNATTVTTTGATTGNTLVSTTSISGVNLAVTAGATLGNADQAGLTTLDWYQEGTFTPVIVGAPTPGVGTYTIQSGNYTRIGNRVYYDIRLGISAHTSTDFMYISGLPFTSLAGGYYPAAVSYSGLVVNVGQQLCPRVFNSLIEMVSCDPAGGLATLISIDPTITSLYICGSYSV